MRSPDVVWLDPLKGIVFVLGILLAFGVLPFTAGWVGGLIAASVCEMKFTFR